MWTEAACYCQKIDRHGLDLHIAAKIVMKRHNLKRHNFVKNKLFSAVCCAQKHHRSRDECKGKITKN